MLSIIPTHVPYPHNPGALYECPACENMYYAIVFMQGEEAYAVLDMLDEDVDMAMDYLSQWDMGEETEHDARILAEYDTKYSKGDYVMSWNSRIGYISLNRKVLPA